ncbi:hypothetical protein LTR56_011257 [Elasticomyces elasticus]|nr:hypothetical protein LTR56_011257 [Elasticomyces elasticus]KAK3668331.1 hypothetical protein LTR22_000622 [Elasticomyces elasticus]KAK4911008.1 hypothetical protein LTR49_020369 [Elasticomyces elasticus]KAK5756482.1 hypothetical protein LTS12_013436 [Elasticomyces elasticus]
MAHRKRKAERSGERSIAKIRRTTTNTNNNAQSAADKVFTIAELLEMILVNVTDMQTLLLGQRVNRMWLDVTSKNKQLQQKLFMAPATRKETIEMGMKSSTVFHVISGGAGDPPNSWCNWPDDTPYRLVMANPLLFRHDPRSWRYVAEVDMSRLVGAGQDIKPGSWQRMYACMPPPQQLYLRVSAKSRGGYGSEHTITGNRTVGQAMDWVETRLLEEGKPQPLWSKSEVGMPMYWRKDARKQNDDVPEEEV